MQRTSINFVQLLSRLPRVSDAGYGACCPRCLTLTDTSQISCKTCCYSCVPVFGQHPLFAALGPGLTVGKVHSVDDPGCCAVHFSTRQTKHLPSMVRYFWPLYPFCLRFALGPHRAWQIASWILSAPGPGEYELPL